MMADALPYGYRLHGLVVASDFELPELASRRLSVADGADVRLRRAPLASGIPLKPTDIPYLHDAEGNALFEFENTARYLVKAGCDVIVDAELNADAALVRLYLLGSVMGMVCHQRGLMTLHASAVAFGNRSVAFVGEQGSGKSTLAAHCLACGGEPVADDVLVVSFDPDGRPLGHAGMPTLKLWRDAVELLGHDPEGLTRDWWRAEKFHMPVDGHSAALPLTRVYLLADDEKAGDGEFELLKGARALSALIEHTYRVEYLDTAARRDAHFHDCARLAETVDVVRLARARDPQRLPRTAALVRDRQFQQAR